MEEVFTVLENKAVGRNLYKYRMLRDVKAVEVADHIGISESQYTKYERGEAKITIDVIQKAAEVLKVDPLQIIATSPGHFVENGSNSPNSVVMAGSTIGGEIRFIDDKIATLMTTLIENQISMNEKIMALLEKK